MHIIASEGMDALTVCLSYRAVETLRMPVFVQCLNPSVTRFNWELTPVTLGLEHQRPIYKRNPHFIIINSRSSRNIRGSIIIIIIIIVIVVVFEVIVIIMFIKTITDRFILFFMVIFVYVMLHLLSSWL